MHLKLSVTLVLATLAVLALVPASALADHNYSYTVAEPITQAELLAGYDDATVSDSSLGNPENEEASSNEALDCGGNPFGQTWWWEFVPPVNGRVTVVAGGYDTVVWIVPFTETALLYGNADAECSDQTADAETVSEYVFAGRPYNIQIGGFESSTGVFESGPLSLSVRFVRDTDGDRILDPNDPCPTRPGVSCPPPNPDSDRDGVPNSVDRCPTESSRARDANRNGCLDLVFLSPPDVLLRPGNFCRGRRCFGIKVVRLVVKEVPPGSRVSVSCTRRGCKRSSKPVGGSGRTTITKLRGKRLRAGVKLSIRVTRPGYVGRVVTYTILRNNLRKKTRCLRPGTTRSVTCSPSLLLR